MNKFIPILMKFIAKNKFDKNQMYWDYYLNFYVRCDNVFVDECSDVEYVEDQKDLDQLMECLRICDNNTNIAFALYAARRRNWRPQNSFYYKIPHILWSNFDACGLDRKVDQFNPKTKPMIDFECC